MPTKKPSKKREARTADADKAAQEAAQDEAVYLARTMLEPDLQAAATIHQYAKASGDNIDIVDLMVALTEQTSAASSGDLKRAEAMLTAQGHTLDAIFNNIARRAINAPYIDHLDCFLKLALRAQSQCRATWETLATIRNPPMMGYVRQANITSGPQQVNNTPPDPNHGPRAGESPNLQNELLEEKDGEWLDSGTSRTAGRVDPAMAAVAEVDRTQERGR